MKFFNCFFNYISDVTSTKRKNSPFWIYEFDEKSYFKDINWKSIKINTFLILAFLLFSNFILTEVLNDIFSTVYRNLDNNIVVNVLVYYLIPICITIYIVVRISRGYLPTITSIILFLIYGIIYLIYIKNNSDFSFLPLENDLIISDIFFILLSIIFSKWSLYFIRKPTSKKNYQFITDDIENTTDIFGYIGITNELNEFIHHTESLHSFAIGIVGNWGDGKTFLSKKISKDISHFSDDYIILEFNPWLHKKENLIDAFFDDLKNIAFSIDGSLIKDFDSYSNKLSGINEHLSMIHSVINLFSEKRTVEELKSIISVKIKQSRKKIVVFVDDTDRLDKEEIHEVLKIIRNSADFANIFFIVGIDYEYIHTNIENPKYLEKIFNVLVALPMISSTIFKAEIKKRFEEHFPKDKNLIEAISTLVELDWFNHFISNLRQLNRLINSLKIPYNKLNNNIDYTDLIILEMFKNSLTAVYNGIYNNNIINYDYYKQLINNEKGWSYNLGNLKLNEKNLKHANSAIEYFLNREEDKHMRAYTKGYQLMYFNYTNVGVNITDFYNLLDNNEATIIQELNIWLTDKNNKSELLNLLVLTLRIDPTKNYKKYINILIGLKDYEFSNQVFRDIYLNEIYSLKENNPTELIGFIDELLEILKDNINKNPLNVLRWASFIFKFLLKQNENIEQSSDLDSKHTALAATIYNDSLVSLLEKDYNFSDKYEAFKNGVIRLENNIFKYDRDFINIFQKHVIENKENLIDFIKYSVIPNRNGQYNENNREVMIIDFLYVVFKDKTYLSNSLINLHDSPIKPLIDYLLEYLDEYYSFKDAGKSNFNKYIKNEDLHKKLLEYFNNKF